MFERILLTLDGSELAETAIPYVRDLAVLLGAEVYLLHVCQPENQAYIRMHQLYMKHIAEDLSQKIKEKAQPGQEPQVHSEVILGNPEKVIFDFVKQKSISVVTLTSHGTSGLRAWAMGSIADKVIRGVGVPTLLVRIKEGYSVQDKKGLIKKILLSVDTSEASRAAVPYAVELAQKLKASIALFSMVPTIYTQNLVSMGGMAGGFGANFDSVDTATQKYTDEYLQGIADEMRKAGIEVAPTSLVSMDAAYEILEMEKKVQPDLVVMATRGRSNIARWALGSVAEKVLRDGERPILLVKDNG